MWLMLGFHQQFLNATPKTAESEHDEMVRWSRCLKVQTGTKPEIQLEVTKLLSGEYTFKTCPSPGIRLFEGGEAGSAQLGTLEPVSEMQISQVWFDNCKAPNDNLSMHVISRWSVRYVSCLPFSQSWFCTLACKNRFLHNLNNLHIFLHWCFFWYWIVELWHNTNTIGQYQWHRAVTGTTPTLWFQILHIVTFRHSTILTCGARLKRFRGLQVVRSMTWMCLMEFTVLTFESKSQMSISRCSERGKKRDHLKH